MQQVRGSSSISRTNSGSGRGQQHGQGHDWRDPHLCALAPGREPARHARAQRAAPGQGGWLESRQAPAAAAAGKCAGGRARTWALPRRARCPRRSSTRRPWCALRRGSEAKAEGQACTRVEHPSSACQPAERPLPRARDLTHRWPPPARRCPRWPACCPRTCGWAGQGAAGQGAAGWVDAQPASQRCWQHTGLWGVRTRAKQQAVSAWQVRTGTPSLRPRPAHPHGARGGARPHFVAQERGRRHGLGLG